MAAKSSSVNPSAAAVPTRTPPATTPREAAPGPPVPAGSCPAAAQPPEAPPPAKAPPPPLQLPPEAESDDEPAHREKAAVPVAEAPGSEPSRAGRPGGVSADDEAHRGHSTPLGLGRACSAQTFPAHLAQGPMAACGHVLS